MKRGNELLTIFFRQNVRLRGGNGLIPFVKKQGWEVNDKDKYSVTFALYIPEHDCRLTGVYFPLKGEMAHRFQYLLEERIEPDELKTYIHRNSHAISFPSDSELAGKIASCYASMVLRHRNKLANAIKYKYGLDKVSTVKRCIGVGDFYR